MQLLEGKKSRSERRLSMGDELESASQLECVTGLVSVGIINYNSGHCIFKALDHLESQTYRPIEIIIIDNASSDGSDARLTALMYTGPLQFIRLRENVGFSRANNIAIRASRGEYFLALNADAFLAPDYVEHCVKMMWENPETGMVGGKLLSDSNPRIIDSAGMRISKEGLAAERGIGAVDSGQFDTAQEIIGVCAAAALYRRQMLEDIKQNGEYFDEDFFAYHEDVDLCVRSVLQGWKNWYCPAAIARHMRGGSTATMSDTIFHLNWRNTRYMYAKTWRRTLRYWNPFLPLAALAVQWAGTRRSGLRFQAQLVRDLRSVKRKLNAKRREKCAGYNYSNIDRLASPGLLPELLKLMFQKLLRMRTNLRAEPKVHRQSKEYSSDRTS